MAKGKQDEYVLSNTHTYGNVTVNVYRPILTDLERRKREEAVKEALAEYGRALYDAGLWHLLEDEDGKQQETYAG